MVETAKNALPLLQATNIDATIISARSAKPLDGDLLKGLVENTNSKIFTLERRLHGRRFGGAILEWSAQHKAKNPKVKQAEIVVVALADRFVEHGARNILLDDYGLSAAKVAQIRNGIRPRLNQAVRCYSSSNWLPLFHRRTSHYSRLSCGTHSKLGVRTSCGSNLALYSIEPQLRT